MSFFDPVTFLERLYHFADDELVVQLQPLEETQLELLMRHPWLNERVRKAINKVVSLNAES